MSKPTPVHKTTKPILSRSSRLGELDVLRGLAALGVVLFHYTIVYPLNYNPEESVLFKFTWGEYGPELFFMISGFVIFMTLEKISRPFDFIVSRFSKLFPCYWSAIFLTSIIVEKFTLFPSELMKVSFREALINLTMLEYWLHVKYADNVYYTLEVELLFYFFMFLIFVTKSMKYIEVFGALWLVIMVLNKFFVPGWAFFVSLQSIFYYLLIYGNFFLAGIIFYNIKTKGNAWYRHAGLGLCLLVQYLIGGSGAETIPVFVFFIFLFYLFVFGRLSFIIQKPLVWLGTISYSLYLIHMKIGFIILQYLDVYRVLYNLQINSFFLLLIPVVCSLIIAALMTYLIEKPVMNFIRKFYAFLVPKVHPAL